MYSNSGRIGSRHYLTFILFRKAQFFTEMIATSVAHDFGEVWCQKECLKLGVHTYVDKRPCTFQRLNGGRISPLMSKRGTISVGSGISRENDKADKEKSLYSAERHEPTSRGPRFLRLGAV